MRSFCLALAVLFLIIGGFLVYHHYLDLWVNQLCDLADAGEVTSLYEVFAQAKPFFSIFLNHNEVGLLEETLARMRVLYDRGEDTDLWVEQELFITRLRGYYENERLCLINLL